MNAPLRPKPTAMPRLSHRHFLSMGYAMIVPIMPADGVASPRSTLSIGNKGAGKVPGVIKDGDGLWWGLRDWLTRVSTLEDLDLYTAMGASVGIRTGLQPDGNTLVAIDADAQDSASAGIVRTAVERRFGQLPCRVGRAPKALYPIRVRGAFRYRRIEFGKTKPFDRVELLSDLRQMVVEGLHPKTMAPYVWTTPLCRYEDLPLVDEADLDALLVELGTFLPDFQKAKKDGDATSAPAQDSLRGELKHIRAAMAALPNTTALFPDRESYLNVGYALKAALPDNREEALQLFLDWCGRWDSADSGEVNDPEVATADFRRMAPPYRLGADRIYDWAQQYSGGAFDRAMIWHEPIPEPAAGSLFPPESETPAAPAGVDVDPIDLFNTASPGALTEPPTGSLPGIVERWARSESRRKGVSMAFASASAIGVLASAIGSSLLIRPRIHDTGWTEPAALWVSLIADPGRGKSPIIAAATEPLSQLDAHRFRTDQAAHDVWAAAEALHKKRKDAPAPGPEPKVRRSVVDDVTLERQVRIHADNPRGLLRAPDELVGLFASLGAYKKNSDGDRTQVLRLFEGRRIMVDRVGSGSIRAEHALMGIVAGTQPEKIRELCEDLGTDGMLQRFLPVMDDGVGRRGFDEPPDEAAQKAYVDAVQHLATAEHGADRIVAQSGAARAVLDEALGQIHSLIHLPGASTAWKGHVEKWPKLLHRIALVFHAVIHVEAAGAVLGGVDLDADTARMAVDFGWFMLRHSLRFYNEFFGQSRDIIAARAVAGYLLTHPALADLDRRAVYQAHRALRGADKLKALIGAMRELETCGWVFVSDRDKDGPTAWKVNRRIHLVFQEHAERERRERSDLGRRLAVAASVARERMG